MWARVDFARGDDFPRRAQYFRDSSVDGDMTPFTITSRGSLHTFDKPVVMGILNVTQDSFYDGGKYISEDAILARAQQIVDEGGSIIDIGTTSTRPGAQVPDPTWERDQLAKVVRLVRGHFPDTILSADTILAYAASAALDEGVDIINDISGGADPNMFPLVAERNAPYILTHNEIYHGDPVAAQAMFFSLRLQQLYLLGVKDVWLDPGFGFAKSTEQNLELAGRLKEVMELFREPMLVGISRKSMIYKPINSTPDSDITLRETLKLQRKMILDGAAIVRVHDVKECVELVNNMDSTHCATNEDGCEKHHV